MNQDNKPLRKLKEVASKINSKHLIASGSAVALVLGIIIFQNGMCDSGTVTTTTATTTATATLGLTINPSSVSPGGQATLQGTGGSGSYSYSIPSGSAGTISGSTYTAPSTIGTYLITVTDTSSGLTYNGSIIVGTAVTLTLNPATGITPTQTVALTATGGIPPYTFSVVSGGGTISPTSAGSGSSVTYTPPADISSSTTAYVQATDSANNTSGSVPITMSYTTGGVNVTINSPLNNDRIWGTSVAIKTTANINLSDQGDSIQSYTYVLTTPNQSVDQGILLGTHTSSSNTDTLNFDTTNQGQTPNGQYTFVVLVTTKNGHQASQSVAVTVSNNNLQNQYGYPSSGNVNQGTNFCDGSPSQSQFQSVFSSCQSYNSAPSGSSLVGLNICTFNGDQTRIAGIQPIYQSSWGPATTSSTMGQSYGASPNNTSGISCQIYNCVNSSTTSTYRVTGLSVAWGGASVNGDKTTLPVTALEINCSDETGLKPQIVSSNAYGCTNGSQPANPSWPNSPYTCSSYPGWGIQNPTTYSCPSGTIAVGVVGNALSGAAIYSIGLVCQ